VCQCVLTGKYVLFLAQLCLQHPVQAVHHEGLQAAHKQPRLRRLPG
jgi:hypothetical protein